MAELFLASLMAILIFVLLVGPMVVDTSNPIETREVREERARERARWHGRL